MRKIVILTVGLIVAAFAAWFLDTIGTNDQVVGVVVPGIPVFFGLVNEYVEDRGKTKREYVRELLRDDAYRNPVVVVLYLILAYQLLQRAIGVVIGAAIGNALGKVVAANPDLRINPVDPEFYNISAVISLLLSLPASVLLAKYAAHHIRDRAVLWIAGGLIVSQLISEVVPFLVYGSTYFAGMSIVSMAAIVIVCLLLVGSAVLGSWWAKRTHRAYILRRLFKRLSPSDQRDLIDLVQTLPGIPD